MPQPTIAVRGHAAVRAQPDEATVSIEIVSVNASPAVAMADAVKRSDLFVEMLDALGIAKRDRTTSGVRTDEQYGPGRGRLIGHRATVSWTILVRDHAIIGDLLSRAVQEFEAEISGLGWAVSLENPARLEAATQAARNARAKAAAYAAGVDAELGEVIGIVEPDLLRPGRRLLSGGMSGDVAVAAAGGGMTVEPGEQELVAAIDVTFAVTLR